MKIKRFIAALLSAVMLCLMLPFTALPVSAEGLERLPQPTATIDYTNETITGLVSGAEYAISSTAGHFATVGGTLSITNYIGSEISLTRKGDGTTTDDSIPTPIIIPSRPAAPSLTAENERVYQANNGKITGLNASLNYECITSGGNYVTISGESEITGLAPGTYYVRLAATSGEFASEETQLTIEAAHPVLYLQSDGTLKYGSIIIIPKDTESPYLGGGSYSFADAVLTINGVNFTTSAATALDLSAWNNPITLQLTGSNSLASTFNGVNNTYGIYAPNALTITGSGSLSAVGGATETNSFGICAYRDFNISGGTITAIAGTGAYSYGIRATAGDVDISGGTVTATGGTADLISYGIYGTNVYISGTPKVTATGGTSSIHSYGINGGNVEISGTPKVTATAGTASNFSFGIYGSLNNTITGGDFTLFGKKAAANTGSITPAIAAVDAANADGRAAVRFDNTEIDLSAIKYIKTYKTEADYLRDYPPEPEPEPQPEPKPSRPSKPSSSSPPRPQTYEPGDTQEYTTNSGITAKVTVTEAGVEVEAGLNKSGSVNSEATAAAVKKAAEIAYANGYKSITIKIPEGATGLSKSTVQKLAQAANGLELVLALTSTIDGEEVGSISLTINAQTGQILIGLKFDTKNIQNVQNYIANKWETDILSAFETAQKGGFGSTATLSVSMDKLGFSADDGTKLYAIIYDTKAKKWYQVSATVEDGNVVINTKHTGIITIVTKSVK
jgi:hypothetical protein